MYMGQKRKSRKYLTLESEDGKQKMKRKNHSVNSNF